MPKTQRVGLHVSAAGGVENAPENAREFGAEVFQFFSRSPRGGAAAKISDEQAVLFRERCEEYGFESYIHSPYYINFASKNKRIYHGSSAVIADELERASKLGVKYVVTHMGSAREWVEPGSITTPKETLEYAVKGLKEVFKGKKKFSSRLLLEISAGSGSVLGDTFEELAFLLNGLGRSDVYVCLDTCHMLASGYDVRTREALDATMKTFKKVIGTSTLKLVHANDSKVDLGKQTDRHEHIGKGYIGTKGFKGILSHPDFQNINFILETKHDAFIKKDIAFLKRERSVQ